jgi:fatty acid desaturase
MKTKILAHSRFDAMLVLLALVQFGVLVYGVATLGAVHWGVSLAMGLSSAFLMGTNFQCIAHNFIHNPFFTSQPLNAAFGMFNSLLVGGPQTLYRLHHLNHHRYNNDLPDPGTGTTRDLSSTFRFGKPPEEEGFLTYSLVGYFRSDFGALMTEAVCRGLRHAVRREFVGVLVMVAAFGWLNWLGLMVFYLPVWLLGNIFAQAENYVEHHGATPGDRRTDSVSCYGRLYNLVWFNNGYHQEHHYRPQLHWTRLPEVKALLPNETERRVVRGAHWFNFGGVKAGSVRDGQ